MSAVRRIEAEEPLSAFTPEQREQLRALVRRDVEQSRRVDRVIEAAYRAAVTFARAVKPDKRWDGL